MNKFLRGVFALIGIIIVTMLIFEVPIIGDISWVIAAGIWLGILASEQEFHFKITWLIVILLNPYIGIILYLAFGLDYRARRLFIKKVDGDKLFDKYLHYSYGEKEQNMYMRILKNIGQAEVHEKTEVKLLINGRAKFDSLLEDIRGAKKYIHLEYYIMHDSKITDQIIEELAIKVSQGVEVRVMIDAIGAVGLSDHNIKLMKNGGIKFAMFSPVRFPLFNEKVNFRNHRKIAVIDGRYGYLGGINIGDEYIEETKKYGKWRDTHMRLSGDVVRDLQVYFARDWYYATKEHFIKTNPDFYLDCPKPSGHLSQAQVVASGPDNKELSIKDLYFKLISTAQSEIIIMTPYLVPDYDVLRALTTAAKNNVTVKIIVPGVPDKKVVHVMNRSYYDDLLKAGVEIYEMNGTFVHSKVMLIDDEVSVVGSTNFDFRSFNLNFEITGLIVDQKVNAELKATNYYDIMNSKQISEVQWRKRSFMTHLARKTIQLFAPFF